MTREEAIAHGKEQLEIFGGEHRDFIEMAIKTLEQIPKLQNRCHVLTHGVICGFCPYECEYRSEAEPQESGE